MVSELFIELITINEIPDKSNLNGFKVYGQNFFEIPPQTT